MKFQLDHDYHIHSQFSLCSKDPEQNCENILNIAEKYGLNELCLTDHFWDSSVKGASDWYKKQDYEHISAALPIPQRENIRFYFGCETDMDKNMNIGISPQNYDKFDFIIIPTTHLHMSGFTIDVPVDDVRTRSEIYTERLAALLYMDLPFEKIGIAHITCPLITNRNWDAHIELIDMVSDKTFTELFERAAKVKVGIEINLSFNKYKKDEIDRIMRPYIIAKKCGCKFYVGSDAHHPSSFETAYPSRQNAINYLELTDEDRFRPFN